VALARSIAVALALALVLDEPSGAATGERTLTGYAVTSWTDADGLPFGGVHAMAQDPSGYLWIGTDAGLLRFDGFRFTPWSSIGIQTLPNTPVLSLCIGADGALWAGLANGGGVYRIQNRQSQRRDTETPLDDSVNAIAEDRHGTIWAVAGSQLIRFGGSGWERVSLATAGLEPAVVSVAVRRNGDVLAGTRTALYSSRDGRDSFTVLTPGWAWATSEDPAGQLWVTDVVAGFRRVEEERHPRPGFERNGYRLLHDRFQNIWLSTSQELLRVSTDTTLDSVIERATLQTGLLNDSVLSLLEDREGNIWAGSTVGLHRITRQRLTPMPNVGLIITATAHDDGLWLGTNYGVVRVSMSQGAWQVSRVPSPPIFVRSLWRDDEGVWVGAVEGLFRISEGGLTPVVSAATLGGPVISIAPDKGGALWLGNGRRVVRWDGNRLEPLRLPPGNEGRRITFVYRDRSERLWLAFANGTAGFLARDGSFRDFPPQAFGPTNTTIHSMIEGRSRTATWFATSHGISRFDGDRITTLGAEQGLPGSRVWTITEDDDGYLWANTDLGAIRFSPDEFAQATTLSTHRFQYHFFDPADGLAGGPIVSVQSGRTPDGQLWFLRGGSLSVVEPASLSQFPSASPTSLGIEMAFADGQRVDTQSGVAFPPRVKRIDVNYSAIALTYPNRIRFRYRLDGFDTSWTEAGTRRTASYTNLPPRQYAFRIEAETDDGLWRATARPWTFSIQPAFYQTWWFYATTVLAMGCAAAAVWRFRLQLDRQKHAMVLAERMRLSREIHDTLLQTMVGVSLQLEDLALEPVRPTGQLTRRLLSVRRQVEGCMRDARRSIKNLRSPMLERQDLVAAIRETGKTATSGTSVDFSVATRGDVRRYPSRIEYEILRIVQEAVINAVRHAKATRIDVVLRFDADRVALEVNDDGCGRVDPPEHEPETHFGVASMTERAESLGGRFALGPSPSGGTRIEAEIPTPAGS